MKINGNDIRLNEPYMTRDGRVAFITTIDERKAYPLAGYIQGEDKEADCRIWSRSGEYDKYYGHRNAIINLDKYNEPMTPETRPHKHADLIAKLVEMLKTDHEAYNKLQFFNRMNNTWENCKYIYFHESEQYRFKPETVTINGVECPKAESEPCKDGCSYWIPQLDCKFLFKGSTWDGNGDMYDLHRLENNLVYLTKEDAITVAKALLKPLNELKS